MGDFPLCTLIDRDNCHGLYGHKIAQIVEEDPIGWPGVW